MDNILSIPILNSVLDGVCASTSKIFFHQNPSFHLLILMDRYPLLRLARYKHEEHSMAAKHLWLNVRL
jgi:hypothetical protein